MVEAVFGPLGILLGAVLGAVGSHWVGRAARREEREAARQSREGEISPDAYALRRQILSWFHRAPFDPESIEEAESWARLVSVHFDTAEARATRIAAAAAAISSERADAARRAYLRFYQAADAINAAVAGDVVSRPKPDDPQVYLIRPGAMVFVDRARLAFDECIEALEQAMDPALLKQVQELEASEAPPK